jgi:hypothetical protein
MLSVESLADAQFQFDDKLAYEDQTNEKWNSKKQGRPCFFLLSVVFPPSKSISCQVVVAEKQTRRHYLPGKQTAQRSGCKRRFPCAI